MNHHGGAVNKAYTCLLCSEGLHFKSKHAYFSVQGMQAPTFPDLSNSVFVLQDSAY